MTPTELRAVGLALRLNNSELARRLGLTPRTMRRMLSAESPITDRTIKAVRALMDGPVVQASDWPRDEWIVGEGSPPDRREYVIHTRSPRFMARVVAIDTISGHAEPDEDPADIIGGTVYDADESTICEVAWIDPAPSDPVAMLALLERAADQLEWDRS